MGLPSKVAARSRNIWNRGKRRLRANGSSLLLAALGAGLSYYLAGFLFANGQPFFAPIAAVVCMGLTAGQRVRRAIEIVAGVVLGLLVADLLIYTVGSGPIQLTVAVLFASGAAVALVGPRNLLSNQAAIAAVLVVALMPVSPNPFGPFGRLLEALIGGGTALVLTTLFARDPLIAVRRAASEVVAEMDATLSEIMGALERKDLDLAEVALESSSDVARAAQELDAAVSAARETGRLARHRRARLTGLPPYVVARARMDILVSTLRGLARAAANTVRYGQEPAPELAEALGHLQAALSEVERAMRGESTSEQAQAQALHAAKVASEILDRPHPLTATVMVGHIRSAAIDLLRATGVGQVEAIRRLEEAAGRMEQGA